MGNACSACCKSCCKKCKRGKEEGKKAKVRRIYVGNVPELKDTEDDDAVVGKPGKLQRSSNQSFHDKEFKPEVEEEVPVVPVRRQSIVDTDGKGMPPKNNFRNNEVTSSKYTLWNFFFKNLFEQFRRVVNFYFLFVAIIQSSFDSPVNPATSIIPLVFVVVVTMIKQGYEDWLRHKADNVFNNRPVKIVNDGVIELIRSKDIRVGDVVKLDADEQVPADVVLLGSSDEFQRCLLNTANLDGETTLKMRYVPAGLPHFRDESDFADLAMIVECEEPCEDLYRFNGNMLMPPGLPRHESSMGVLTSFTSNQAFQPDPELQALIGHGHGIATAPSHDESKMTAESHDGSMLTNMASASSTGNNRQSKSLNRTSHLKIAIPDHLKIRLGKQRRLGISDFNMIFLGMENVILRGTKIKNTDYIYGIVVYTGPDTRLARNSNISSPKFSTIEKTVNKYLFVFILILALLVITATILSTQVDWIGDPWYLSRDPDDQSFSFFFETFASFLILFNYIIPISLYVTMEMQKFFGSKFFVWDEDMATEQGEPPLCNTSDLNEELGQIEYLFSDKTGTLTENVMKTRMFSVNSNVYEVEGSEIFKKDPEDQTKQTAVEVCKDDYLKTFCKVLSLCHSIQIMPKRRPSVEFALERKSVISLFLKKRKTKISSKVKNANSLFTIGAKADSSSEDIPLGFEFQGSSPDEKALVEACVSLGVVYEGEKEDVLTLTVCGKEEKFKRHLVLEFDADRKCMSVVVENSNGEIYIMTKGAETSVIPRCVQGNIDEVNSHVLNFARMGFRTLVIAQRKITKSQLGGYLAQLKAARRLVDKRDDVMRQIYKDMESNLEVLGATGVEDQLQEGVVETLHALVAAGIRVWVLTGDKVETAVAVAYACGLLTSMSNQLVLCKFSEEFFNDLHLKLLEMRRDMDSKDNNVLILDGETLEVAFKHDKDLFCTVAMKCFRVVCCRMTPLQKSQVVRMVKETPSKPITAAVGDGANDVAMIEEAHIGLGIIGKEGRQAARCADFALAKFGFLKKAILVHGHWYYVRLANLANYFFYKNIIFVFPQVLFCWSTGFSPQALFNVSFLMLYNIFYTACPILVYGLSEQPYSAAELMQSAHLYQLNRRNSLMTKKVFCKWLVLALWHAAICYYFAYYSWPSFYPVNGIMCFGTVVFSEVVIVANMKIALETHYVSWACVCSHIYSYTLFFTFEVIYSEFELPIGDPKFFSGVLLYVMSLPVFWVLMVLVPSTALMPDIIIKAIEGSWDSVTKFFRSFPRFKPFPKVPKAPQNENKSTKPAKVEVVLEDDGKLPKPEPSNAKINQPIA